ncbi:hypothetical protein D915_005015 [Fasciola hepatica]|uniref:Uncharacterized protein n=1 Tax=Fasciola hepatica TaxID=6192 RepID=A0A4E0RAF3_FASHE|nr:hypothetical protein D915_005015 [Fasciola hepatica]
MVHLRPAAGEKNASSSKAEAKNAKPDYPGSSPLSKHAPGMGVRLRASPEDRPSVQQRLLDRGRTQRFRACISAPVIELSALRQLSWSGVPGELRPTVWKLLCVSNLVWK